MESAGRSSDGSVCDTKSWTSESDYLTAIIDTQNDVAAVELDSATVMQMIVERTQSLSGADGAVIELIEGEMMVYRAACGSLGGHVGLRLAMGSSLSGLCARSGELISCEDAQCDERADRQACRRLGIRSMVLVPLPHDGRVVGVLKVVSSRVRGFDPRAERGLRLMAGLLASSLSHAAEFGAKRKLLSERAESLAALQTVNDRLRESEERFRLLAQNAQDLIFRYEFSPRRRYAYISPAIKTLSGYTPEECYADPDIAFCLTHPEDQGLFGAMVRGELAPPASGFLVRFVHKDGHIVWTEQRCVPIRDSAGKLIAVEGITRDVSDRVRAETALRESEERFRSAFDHAAIGKALVALDGRWLKVNRSLCRILGYTEEELLTRDFQSITYPADLDTDLGHAGRLLSGEIDDYHMVKRYIHRQGHLVWALLTGSLVRAADGEPVHFIAQVQDITSRKQAEESLRASEEEYRATFELAGVGKLQTDLTTGRMVRVNRKLCEILGYSADELACMTFAQITHPDDLEAGLEGARRMRAGEASEYNAEKRYIRKDGRTVWVNLNAAVIRDTDGRALRTVCTIQDVTERKRAEWLERDQRRVLEMVAKDLPLVDVLEQLASAVERQVEGATAAMMVLEEGSIMVRGLGLSPMWRDAMSKRSLTLAAGLSSGLSGDSTEGCGVTYLRSDELWAEMKGAAEMTGLETCWAVGVRSSDGAPLGVMTVFHREHRRPTAVELQTLEMAGRLASICVEHYNCARQLAHLVRHDALTGLPNRICFEDRLGQAIVLARRNGGKVGVLVMDVDRFKLVNDSLGHDAGDSLLQQFAHRVLSQVRESDTVARMGGDEFSIILPDLVGPEGASVVAEKLLASLKRPFPVGGQELAVTASMGIALYPTDGEDSATLQQRADEQMYATKRRGRDGYSIR